MANELGVDAGGLLSGAEESLAIARRLNETSADGSTPTNQPSMTGLAAVTSAISKSRNRQSIRVKAQADDMRAAAALYDSADRQPAGYLAQTV